MDQTNMFVESTGTVHRSDHGLDDPTATDALILCQKDTYSAVQSVYVRKLNDWQTRDHWEIVIQTIDF